jgi:hypothetical protein
MNLRPLRDFTLRPLRENLCDLCVKLLCALCVKSLVVANFFHAETAEEVQRKQRRFDGVGIGSCEKPTTA